VDLDRPSREIEAAARRCVPDAFAVPSAAPVPAASRGAFDED
jgi:hypothetical protein